MELYYKNHAYCASLHWVIDFTHAYFAQVLITWIGARKIVRLIAVPTERSENSQPGLNRASVNAVRTSSSLSRSATNGITLGIWTLILPINRQVREPQATKFAHKITVRRVVLGEAWTNLTFASVSRTPAVTTKGFDVPFERYFRAGQGTELLRTAQTFSESLLARKATTLSTSILFDVTSGAASFAWSVQRLRADKYAADLVQGNAAHCNASLARSNTADADSKHFTLTQWRKRRTDLAHNLFPQNVSDLRSLRALKTW